MTATKILLNVCLNLMIAYTVFVVGVENVSDNLRCIIITILLHYFFLASWCWMTVYSYDLYLSLVKVSVRKSVYKVGSWYWSQFGISKVFRETYGSTFLRRSFLFSYGLPLIIVILNVSITVGYLDTIGTSETCNGGKN